MAGAGSRWLRCAVLLALAWPARGGAQASTRHFELVGHTPLPNPGGTIARGGNGPTGISGDCLYVGSRLGHRAGTGPAFGTPPLPPEVLIVDIAHPRRPHVAGVLPTLLHASPRALHTIPDAHALLLMNVRETGPGPGAVSSFQLHDITDCRRPVLRQTVSLGADRPHASFLWRDPHEPARFLLYVSFHPGDTRGPLLRVHELMAPPDGPISPEPVATFTVAPADSHVPIGEPFSWRDAPFVLDAERTAAQRDSISALSVSRDGTRVSLAHPDGGATVLDSSRLASREPCLRDAVPVDATGPGESGPCLRELPPEPAAGVAAAPARLAFPHLSFASSRAAGLRAWDITNALRPREVGAYMPRPASRVVERLRDGHDGGMEPSPILYRGLLYLTDEDSGLSVLRYKGPRASELPRTGLFVSHTHSPAPPPPLVRAARTSTHRGARPWNRGPLEE